MKPKLSVIIPAHNEGKYISKTLKSVISQSFKNFEIIVVADSCTDDTVEIAKKFGCKIIKSKTKNVGKNRNIGAHNAASDIYVFLDADVTISGNYLQEVYDAARKGFESGRPYYYTESNNFFVRNIYLIINLLNIIMYPNTCFATKSCFDGVGGYPEFFNNVHEDSLFAQKVTKKYKATVVNAYALNSSRRFDKNGGLKEYYNQVCNALDYVIFYKIFNKRTRILKPIR
ncbi:MAG: glycosyltransferase [archaeon]